MIYLSFDIEEFDIPLENSKQIGVSEQIRISSYGVKKILELLKQKEIKATFFCTANFAEKAPEIIKLICEEGHEIDSNGYYHSSFEVEDLIKSRQKLQELTGQEVKGYRMARMMKVDECEVSKAGYSFNSSINPTFIPGRYNNFFKSKKPFYNDNLLEIPVAVTPFFRIPLFWLALHLFPYPLYKYLVYHTVRHNNSYVTYFHPWEFYNLKDIQKKYNLSHMIVKNSGDLLYDRLSHFIDDLKNKGYKFGMMTEILEIYKK
ncbi:MAG: polysaccharide deacetylase family protein [Bacteroidales bacterium]